MLGYHQIIFLSNELTHRKKLKHQLMSILYGSKLFDGSKQKNLMRFKCLKGFIHHLKIRPLSKNLTSQKIRLIKGFLLE